jgi:hypothetical protein
MLAQPYRQAYLLAQQHQLCLPAWVLPPVLLPLHVALRRLLMHAIQQRLLCLLLQCLWSWCTSAANVD